MPERGAASRRVDWVAQVVPASEPGGRQTRRSRPAQAAAPRPRTPTIRNPDRRECLFNCRKRAAECNSWSDFEKVGIGTEKTALPGLGWAAAVPSQRLGALPTQPVTGARGRCWPANTLARLGARC
jgi:hypothetical protein